jgi:hypothetical protein
MPEVGETGEVDGLGEVLCCVVVAGVDGLA